MYLRHFEEMMREHGVFVDYATVYRRAIKMVPVLAAVFRWRKHSVGKSCRIDETYIKVAGAWKYLYLAVDRAGETADFMKTAKGDLTAARQFLERAINLHDVPGKITTATVLFFHPCFIDQAEKSILALPEN
jgi:putative transposase